MSTSKFIITAILVALMTGPAAAVLPEIIINNCAERDRADSDPTDTGANYHTEYVIGYLAAVLDSLNEDGLGCSDPIDERRFCGAFKTYVIQHGASGGYSFKYARDALMQAYSCNGGK